MRIGFIGNQNNYPFILARALRVAGHDVRVIIDQKDSLDRPECRYADIPYPYPGWIKEMPEPVRMVDIARGGPSWLRVLDAVRDCDALVLNRWGYDAASRLPMPAFCLTTGADVDFFSHPSGAERYVRGLDHGARPRGWWQIAAGAERLDVGTVRATFDHAPAPLHRAWQKWIFSRLVQRQRAGLRRAVGISAFPDVVSQPLAEVMADCLAPGTPRFCLMMADTDWIRPRPAPVNPVLRMFNASRLLWKKPFPSSVGEWANKGTDVLLEGVARWHHRTGGALDLRLVEKGVDLDATKSLVSKLGIAHLVHWQREMTQHQVFDEYERADIVSEQCGTHVLGMAGYEAMAMSRPVLANGRPEVFTAVFGAAPPVAQARTPDEVAAQLDRLTDAGERARLGRAGRQFVEQRLSPQAAAAVVAEVLSDAIARRAAVSGRCA